MKEIVLKVIMNSPAYSKLLLRLFHRLKALGLTRKCLTGPKKLSGTNTLAYLAPPSVTKKKSFITLTPAHRLREKKFWL